MSASAAGGLFAGVGRSDITPAPNFPNGMWMAQKHLRGGGIHRRLFIQCVIIGADDDAVALLNYDLCILSATQDFYDREGADEVQDYIRALPERSANAAKEAWDARRPARVASGSGSCH